MALTPVEIRHITFGRGVLGYKRAAVDTLLGEIADSFEDVWRDRADLADKVEQLEHDLVRYRELETLLRTTLVSAERAAHDLRDQAKREAALIVSEAQAEAREITRKARADFDRLDAESRRITSLLRSALDTVAGEESSLETPAEPEASGEAYPEPEPEPERDEVRPEPIDLELEFEPAPEVARDFPDRWEAA
jgi:DivIVA domain-containing protein